MQRLIVVSNRLPITLSRTDEGKWESNPATGGLVTALMPVLERRGGVWVGWPGIPTGESAGLKRHLRAVANGAAYTYAPVSLTRKEVAGFYQGFSNEVLWPLFHDLFAACIFDPEFWRCYVQVNRKFARETAAVSEASDFIWVQDYHLMHVAAELRALGTSNRVGFFLHIPFPSPDIYRKIPWRRNLLEALVEFDQLGFQTVRDRDNFLDCTADLLSGSEVSADGTLLRLRVPGSSQTGGAPSAGPPRDVRVGSYPISIDYGSFARRAATNRVEALTRYLGEESKGRCIILGVDRLDYSKGLTEKLAAFRNALSRYRVLRKRVTLVQHVVPSREDVPEYHNLKLKVERMVGEVNGHFSAPGWVPVHYFYHTLTPDELSAYYRSADIALVTSLRDGMNLVSKEYCACRIHDDGVLILSEFAGAAGELAAGALIVNPFDVEAVAEAIHRAFAMEPSEQRMRMRKLRRAVRAHDVYRWVDTYLDANSQPARPEPAPPRRARAADPVRPATGMSTPSP